MDRTRFKAFLKDSSGAVASTYALALVGLIVIGGVGFDYGRLVAMDSELQNGADQAALAGATQLDGKSGAMARAKARALDLVTNTTLIASDANTITFADSADCTGNNGCVLFWQDKAKTNAATTDANARFIEVKVALRTVDYAFTPVAGLLSGGLAAGAMAGLGSSICRTPPIMICNPNPGTTFNSAGKEGMGIVATGHDVGSGNGSGTAPGHDPGGGAGEGTSNTWAPGDFGFLQVNDADPGAKNAKLLKALAYANPPIDCTPVEGNQVSTGNPQGLYDAINTRFDIYDFNDNGGNTLAGCRNGLCPSAPNVIKDLYNANPNSNNGCKIKHGGGKIADAAPGGGKLALASSSVFMAGLFQSSGGGSGGSNGNSNGGASSGGAGGGAGGWDLPDAGREFKPVPQATWNNETLFDDNGVIDVMGLPRDNCHYTSYNTTGICPNGRFGDKTWARADYFKTNHTAGGVTSYPPDWSNITRYKTYLWEIAQNNMLSGTGNTDQRGRPVCYAGSPPGGAERRVLTVAVVDNCSALNGTSTAVEVGEWIEVFLVEPSLDAALRYNAYKDAIYMEIIGPSKLGGFGAAQTVRRDVPYLVE